MTVADARPQSRPTAQNTMSSVLSATSALVRLNNPALSVAVPSEGGMRDFDPAKCRLGVMSAGCDPAGAPAHVRYTSDSDQLVSAAVRRFVPVREADSCAARKKMMPPSACAQA